MPFCPGCEREVSHERLDRHVRYCPHLNGGNVVTMAAVEQLDRRLATVERTLQDRMQQLETDPNPALSRVRGPSDSSSEKNNNP